MQKINILLSLGLIFLLISGISAGYWIGSNIMTFTVEEYTLTLTSDIPEGTIEIHTTIHFTAHLLFGSNPVADALVSLRQNGTEIDSALTDSLGKCYFTVVLDKATVYKFNATYFVG